MTRPKFSGPVIDRDVFEPGIPEHYESDIPYFYVQMTNDQKPFPDRWRFWFEPDRGGWIWDGKRC